MDYNRFLPRPFQFMIHNHAVIRSCMTFVVEKALLSGVTFDHNEGWQACLQFHSIYGVFLKIRSVLGDWKSRMACCIRILYGKRSLLLRDIANRGSTFSQGSLKRRFSLGRFALKKTFCSIVYAILITVVTSWHCHQRHYWTHRHEVQWCLLCS
jgi:hypothetical protein